jgi:endoglucanase
MLTSDWQKLKANGIDHVRLPFKPSTMFTSTAYTTFVSAQKSRYDALIAAALSFQLSVILDCHGTDPTDIANSYAGMTVLWQTVSNAYKTQPVDNGTPTGFGVYYEIFNEPQESDPTTWTNKHNAAIAAVRAIDTSGRKIIVDGLYGADPNGFDALSPLTDTGVIYSFHLYEPFTFTHCGASWVNLTGLSEISYPTDPNQVNKKLAAIFNNDTPPERFAAYGRDEMIKHVVNNPLSWCKTYNVPLYCGEGGVYASFTQTTDANRWYQDYITAMSDLGIGYNLFCYGTTIFPINDTVLGYVKADAATKIDGLMTANGKKYKAADEGDGFFTQFVRLLNGKRPVTNRNALPTQLIQDNLAVHAANPLSTSGGAGTYNQFAYGIGAGNTSSVNLIASNSNRKHLSIQNQSTSATIWLRFSDSANATMDGYSYKLEPGKCWPEGAVGVYPTHAVNAISDMAGITSGYHYLQVIEGY